jgi:hypothetical protein
MSAREYPIRHFGEMKRLAEALDRLPAQILEHSYSYLSFGSWTLTFRYKGRLFRLTFDGRDHEQSLERSLSEHSPHDWDTVWRQTSLNDIPAPNIVDVIVRVRDG